MIEMIARQLKIFLRSKPLLFWSTLFPIFLAIFFQLALGNIGRVEMETISIAYLNQPDEQRNEILTSITQSNGDPLFEVIETDSNEEAIELLETDEVAALIDFEEEELGLVIKNEEMTQLITSQVIGSVNQYSSMFTNIMSENPQADLQAVIDTISEEVEYYEPNSDEDSDFSTHYFYTLIGMQAMYGYMWGLTVINQNEANQSIKGMRIQTGPTRKSQLIISGVIASVMIHYVSMLLLLAFLYFGLGVEFGPYLPHILLLTLVGTLAGVSMGTVIGSSNTKSYDAKIGMGIALSMTLSALAGMMMAELKLIIQQNAPILAIINPITQILDGLNGLYYYDSLDRYWLSIITLLLFSLVMSGLSIFFSRRKQYDSL